MDVRDTIAAYTMAVDDGRTDDVVATFCPDGRVDLPGVGAFTGHAAIRAAFSGMKSRPSVKHVVVNTHVTECDGESATAISDLIVLRKDASGWVIHLVGRYFDVLHHGDGGWRFHARKLEF
jgi:ketosteroid isomerase-like protein